MIVALCLLEWKSVEIWLTCTVADDLLGWNMDRKAPCTFHSHYTLYTEADLDLGPGFCSLYGLGIRGAVHGADWGVPFVW